MFAYRDSVWVSMLLWTYFAEDYIKVWKLFTIIMQSHLVTNQASRLGAICKADFPKVGAVRHEMVRPVLSYMVHSLFCYIHVLKTGMFERNKKMLWLSGCGSMLRQSSTAFHCPLCLEKGPWESTARGSHLCRFPACPHGRDFLRTHPFPADFFFLFKKRKWWESLLSPLSQQQFHGVPDSIWVFTLAVTFSVALAVTFSVTAVATKMWVYMSSDTCMC